MAAAGIFWGPGTEQPKLSPQTEFGIRLHRCVANGLQRHVNFHGELLKSNYISIVFISD
eukprot:CCRYP_017047-RA/>CCRYP_017047-RA protein AED:0.11 eAED:0.11 QI:41/1/1/1/0/0.5/2/186/58